MTSPSFSCIRATRLVADSKSSVIQDGALLVDNLEGKIVAVGTWADVRPHVPSDARMVQLGDATLMPGLFDCHVHLCLDPSNGLTTGDAASTPEDVRLRLMYSNALKLLDAGVTTARDLGCPGTSSVTVREAIRRQERLGPRMLVANPPITVPGGHAHSWGGEAAGIEDVRRMAQRRVDEGSDVIKVMSTGGFMTAGSHPSEARYSIEELSTIVEVAHKAGIKVTTHACGVEGISRAVKAGLDCIEHCSWSIVGGTRFDADVAQLIVDRGVTVCPTMNTACTSSSYFCPWDSRQNVLSNLASLRRAGAKTIVGTDAGIALCHFERYCDGLQVMHEAGYTPREIFHAATAGAAVACNLEGVTGRLEPGLAADIAAFRGNPVERVADYERPCYVMARGREHSLRPIAPLGDQSEKIGEIWNMLRQGAGLPKEVEAH